MSEDETNDSVERGLPEPILVKQTFLRAFWKCLDLFRQYKTATIMDNGTMEQEKYSIKMNLCTGMMEVYMAVRNKFTDEQKAKFESMDHWIIEDKMEDRSLLTIKYLFECYVMLQDKLESLGITAFEQKQLPPGKAVYEE